MQSRAAMDAFDGAPSSPAFQHEPSRMMVAFPAELKAKAPPTGAWITPTLAVIIHLLLCVDGSAPTPTPTAGRRKGSSKLKGGKCTAAGCGAPRFSKGYCAEHAKALAGTFSFRRLVDQLA